MTTETKEEIAIEPRHGGILVKMMQKKRIGAILMPNNHATEIKYAEVVRVGPGDWNTMGTERKPIGLKAGDVVIMNGARTGFKVSDEHHLIHDSEVIAVEAVEKE